MSAFWGIVFFDKDRPVHRSLVETMASALENSGKDGSAKWTMGSAAVVYRPFHTTAESRREHQPLIDGQLVLTFAGRIDNRDELAKALALRESTDAEIVLACYKAWGGECFGRIFGDFAVAILDTQSKELVLARDPFAVSKLFYAHKSDRIIWSTDIGAMLSSPEVSDVIEESFVGMSLAFLPDGKSTPFRDIIPVPPGHVVVLGMGKLRSTQYWSISACLETRLDSTRSMDEQFRYLLRDSLRACLRSDRPVTAELSGGLDSSTIVCATEELSNESGGSMRGLNTLSFVYDQAQQSDERQFISVIEKHLGRRGIHLKEDDDPILSRWPDPDFVAYPNRVHCFGGAVEAIYRAMDSLGSRVLLSGLFGDQLFVSYFTLPYDAADMVRERSYLQAYRTCHSWSVRTGRPLLQVAWHGALRNSLPYWMRRAQMYTDERPPISNACFKMPAWLDGNFMKRIDLRDRIHRVTDMDAQWKAGSRGIRFANLMQAVGWFASGYAQNQTTFGCIEMRYPYLYRPLVEFLIALPFGEHCNERSVRALQRRAMRGIVPELVRTRTDKRGPHEAILLAARREQRKILALIESSRAAEAGFVLKSEMLKEARRWCYGHCTSDMLKFLATEIWLRALERRRNAASGAHHGLPNASSVSLGPQVRLSPPYSARVPFGAH